MPGDIIVITQYFKFIFQLYIEVVTSKVLVLTFFAHFCIVRSRERKQPYFNHKRSGSHQNPCAKTGRTCRITQSLAKKSSFREIDATSCRRTDGVVALSFCDGAGLFKNMGKFARSKGSRKSGEAPGTCYANDAENLGGTEGAHTGKAGAQRGIPPSPPITPLPSPIPSFSRSLLL